MDRKKNIPFHSIEARGAEHDATLIIAGGLKNMVLPTFGRTN